MAWTIALDCIVILLLCAGIFYAWRLERMLRGLDGNRQEMEKFLAVFSSSISRAERGIRDLQDTAQDSGVEVDRAIAKAAALRDELSYLIDAADKIASRLTDTGASAIARAPTPLSVVEQPPIPVIKDEPVAPAPAATEKGGVPPWAKRATEKHVVINRPEKKPEKPEEKTSPRSEAERELQQALEKMR